MRKFFMILALICCVALIACITVACDFGNENNSGENSGNEWGQYGVPSEITPQNIAGVYYTPDELNLWLKIYEDGTWWCESAEGTYVISDDKYSLILYSGDEIYANVKYYSDRNAIVLKISDREYYFNLHQSNLLLNWYFIVDNLVYKSEDVPFGSYITEPNLEERNGYYFDGWYTDSDYTTKWDFENSRVASSGNLYGRWLNGSQIAINHDFVYNQISYVSYNGLYGGSDLYLMVFRRDYDANFDVNSFDMSDKVYIDYNMTWQLFRDADCTEEIVDKVATGIDGTLAEGDNIFYLRTYYPDDTVAHTFTLNLHKSHPVLAELYGPLGNSIMAISFSSPIFSNNGETLEKWADKNTYDFSGRDNFEGYQLSGWIVDDEEYNETGLVKRNVNIYPICTPNGYTVTLDACGGEVSETTLEFAYDSSYTLPVPTHDKWTFAGWRTNDGTMVTDKTGECLEPWKFNENQTFSAKWTVTVTLSHQIGNLNDGNVYKPSIKGAGVYEVGTTVTIGADLTGYDFTGWYDANDNKTLISEQSYITFEAIESVSYRANWYVSYKMTNYISECDATSCKITGVVDTSVTELYIPEYVDAIWCLFNDCYNLEKIEVESGNEYYYSLDGILYQSGRGTADDSLLCVPYKLSGEIAISDKVTRIPSYAFYWCSEITAVTIPDGITEIGECAFQGCTSITSLVLPDSVTQMGRSAFSECTNLISITIPDGITIISDSMFANCEALTSFAIPLSVKEIGNSAFFGCSGFTSFTIHYGVTKIGNSAFQRCSGLTSMTIPDTVVEFGSEVFCECSALESVNIGYGVSCIDEETFYDCIALESVVIPDSVTSIGDRAFYGCSSLTSIYYAGDITGWCGISGLDYVMSNRRTLYIGGKKVEGEIVLPNGIESIPNGAFYGCSGLTSVSIPDSVTSIGYMAFLDCSGLTSIYYTGDIRSWLGKNWHDEVMRNECILHIDGKKVEGELAIPDGIESIPNYAFAYQTDITSVVIPDSVTNIGHNAFSYCSGLTSINIPDSVTSIGDMAFYGCSGLTSVSIPDSVTSIGDGAFYGCSGLTSVSIPDSVTNIGISAFEYCSGLTSITIPDSVTSIGAYAFYGCSSLTSVSIPDSVTQIGGRAFYGCSGLTSINIPDSVTSIGWGAFRGCSGLTSVTIGDSVTSIGGDAFSDCSGLTSVYYTGDIAGWCGIEFVGYNANPLYYAHKLYINNTLLTDLVIPDGVTSIGNYAFSGCRGLTSVSIGSGVTSIGDYAFNGCSGLTSITIPDSVINIGSGAFLGCGTLSSVDFDNVSGWQVDDSGYFNNGIDISAEDLSDAATAAKYVTSDYCDYYWKRV